jgi:hypothetical protein
MELVVRIKDKEYTEEEAREIYEFLKRIFGTYSTQYPNPPFSPWIGPIINSPQKIWRDPIYPQYDITCQGSTE